jgi:hypothetical protein
MSTTKTRSLKWKLSLAAIALSTLPVVSLEQSREQPAHGAGQADSDAGVSDTVPVKPPEAGIPDLDRDG